MGKRKGEANGGDPPKATAFVAFVMSREDKEAVCRLARESERTFAAECRLIIRRALADRKLRAAL